jgi:hypothetical protein
VRSHTQEALEQRLETGEAQGAVLIPFVCCSLRECDRLPAVYQLFTSKDQTLLIGRNTFLILDFSLYVFNSVGGFNFKSNCLSGKGLDEYLRRLSLSCKEFECDGKAYHMYVFHSLELFHQG